MNRDKADKILQDISNYLEASSWKLDDYTLRWIDPVTGTKHSTLIALEIELDRVLSK